MFKANSGLSHETVTRSINYKKVIEDLQSFEDWKAQKTKPAATSLGDGFAEMKIEDGDSIRLPLPDSHRTNSPVFLQNDSEY